MVFLQLHSCPAGVRVSGILDSLFLLQFQDYPGDRTACGFYHGIDRPGQIPGLFVHNHWAFLEPYENKGSIKDLKGMFLLT